MGTIIAEIFLLVKEKVEFSENLHLLAFRENPER